MALVSSHLTTSPNNIVSGTSSENKAITCVYFCNITGSTATINVYAVPSGSTTTDCIIYKNPSVASADTVIMDMEKLILGDGDSLYASCSTDSAIVMTVSYVGI